MDKPVVLCVDDEKSILSSLKKQLKLHFGDDFHLEMAESGEEALEILEELIEENIEVPVVIADHIMPGMKGDELLIQVRELLPKTLSIMLTGQANADAVGNAINYANLYRYIAKPWKQTDLTLTLEKAVRSYFQDKRLEEQNETLQKVNLELEQLNATLESQVKKRTEELEEQKEKLRESESRFRGLSDATFEGIIIHDNGQILDINETIVYMFGYRRDELLGKNLRDILLPPSHDTIRQHVSTEESMPCEVKGIKKDQSMFPAEIQTKTIFSHGHTIVGIALRDITERKQTERELLKAKEIAEAANHSKSQFLARMSHEIRTPMNAIIGLSHLVMQTHLSSKQNDYLRKIQSAAHALLGIINDILDFSKIEAGKLELESIDFYLEDIFTHLSDVVSMKATEKGIEILFETGKDVPYVLVGDPLRLGQILINLVNNAIKFTETGEIVITTELLEVLNDDVKLRFSVKDTGIGIVPEQLAVLFQPFSQADGSTTRKYGGSGLGLVICKRLVEIMRGDIRVNSELGRGSTFTFTAVFGRRPEEYCPPVLSMPELQGLRVLVVDDNKHSRIILQNILETFSFKVSSVDSGKAALAELERAASDHAGRSYDLVIMDWKMPEMDGIETVRHMRRNQRLPQIPTVIMVSAYGREEVMSQAKIEGLKDFLIKPVTPSVLFETIMDVFGQKFSKIGYASEQRERRSGMLHHLSGTNILVVEDNPLNQQVAREILEAVGALVEIVDNGMEAVEILKKCKLDDTKGLSFDAILMDVQMPKMDGYEATKQIRQLVDDSSFSLSRLPIIAMTAHATTGEKEKCLNAGMDDYVSKPIDLERLYSVLLKWIEPHVEYRGTESESSDSPVLSEPSPFNTLFSESVPGIDFRFGLQQVVGNETLYAKLLREFLVDYTDVTDVIKNALDKGDIDVARRLVHTLKGVAGHMGAMELHAAARELESGIQGNVPVSKEDVLRNFEKAMAEVVHSINTLEPVLCEIEGAGHTSTLSLSQPAPSALSDNPKVKPLLIELATLLEEGDTEAERYMSTLKRFLRNPGFVIGRIMTTLEEQIHHYNFEDAHDTLLELATSLNILLEGKNK